MLRAGEADVFVKTVGIRYRRVAPPGVTAGDLCYQAALRLLNELAWNPEDIAVLVMITQTPDYLIPNTASVIQQRLGIGKNCMAMDVNLGCSGYVYGLAIAAALLQNIPSGKALLLVGDVSTHVISSQDKSTWPLFSDAGSATALAYYPDADIFFNLQNDGTEFDDIIVTHGGFRNRIHYDSFVRREREKGIIRSDAEMKMDGMKIFQFALREVAPNVHTLLRFTNTAVDSIDYFIFHQANKLMLESVRKKLSVPGHKVPYSLYDYGNTSSASIPVTLVTQLGHTLSSNVHKIIVSGFGVGLSWGSALLKTEQIVCPEMIIVPV
ncbi:MAG: ketoacyl-ACP synthase III [Chitinophagales bacterium]|nr:ketoacyl-ACP synthase III [Chitinophagales bacterium]MDW8418151.1 ketoacyl-ACP synthase III [Chitinophagales bacterium]